MITIDWRPVWWRRVKWTDTSFFRNAATDLTKEKTEMTVSDSINASLSKWWADKITALQLADINAKFKSMLSWLTET